MLWKSKCTYDVLCELDLDRNWAIVDNKTYQPLVIALPQAECPCYACD